MAKDYEAIMAYRVIIVSVARVMAKLRCDRTVLLSIGTNHCIMRREFVFLHLSRAVSL